MSDELYSNLNEIMNASVSQQIDNKISDDRNKAIDIAEETGDKAELADIGIKDEPLEFTAEVQASAFTTAKKASLGKETVWGGGSISAKEIKRIFFKMTKLLK